MKNLLITLGEMACDVKSTFTHAFKDFNMLQEYQTIILHPIADTRYDDKTMQLQYEIGTELGVVTLLVNAILTNEALHNNAKSAESLAQILDRLSSFDFGHISSESSLSQEELESIMQDFAKAQNHYIALGRAFAYHKDNELIFKMLGLLSKYTGITIIANKYSDKCGNFDFADLGFLDEVESKLEKLPESNGAFVYFSPKNSSNIDSTHKIEATKQFLSLAKCNNGGTITLKKPPINITCKAVESQHLRGVVGIISSANIDSYPFIPLQELL